MEGRARRAPKATRIRNHLGRGSNPSLTLHFVSVRRYHSSRVVRLTPSRNQDQTRRCLICNVRCHAVKPRPQSSFGSSHALLLAVTLLLLCHLKGAHGVAALLRKRKLNTTAGEESAQDRKKRGQAKAVHHESTRKRTSGMPLDKKKNAGQARDIVHSWRESAMHATPP